MRLPGCVVPFLLLTPALPAATVAYVPVCCNANSTVSVIDTTHNRVSGSFSAGPGSYAVALVGTHSAWVANANNKTISIVKLASGALRKTLSLQLQPWALAASLDGTRVYAVTGDFTQNQYTSELLAFDSATGNQVGSATIPNDGLVVPGIVISPDSQLVYATFDSQTVVVYDVSSGTLAATWKTTRTLTWAAAGSLTLSPDGSILYTGGQVLTAINTSTGSVIGTVAPPGPSRAYSFVGTAVTPDGSTLYASYASQIGVGSGLATIDTATLHVTASAGLGGELVQPILSHDGSALYVPDVADSVVYIVATSSLAATGFIPLMGPLATATMNAGGTALYVPNASTGALQAVDTSTFNTLATITVSSPPTGATATADGKRIFVAGSASNSVTAIDAASNQVSATYTIGEFSPSVTGDNPGAVLVTPNGKKLYLATSSINPALAEIDVATGKVNGVPCAAGDPCQAFSIVALPDSRKVYISGWRDFGEAGVAAFYDIRTAQEKMVRHKAKPLGTAMAASPTGKFLYINMGRRIGVYDTTQNKVTSVLPITAYAFAFSPDGSVAYGANGATIHIIDTSTGKVKGSYALSSTTSSLAVSPDGSQIWAPLDGSTSVEVVNTQTGGMQMVTLSGGVGGIAFGQQ